MARKEAYDADREKLINRLRKALIYLGHLLRTIKQQEYVKSNLKKKDINKAIIQFDDEKKKQIHHFFSEMKQE